MKIGDKVETLVGCRISGPFGVGKITKLTQWAEIPAAVVTTADGKRHTCLCRNLILHRHNQLVKKWRDLTKV